MNCAHAFRTFHSICGPDRPVCSWQAIPCGHSPGRRHTPPAPLCAGNRKATAMKIRKLGLATVAAVSIVSYGAQAETTNEQSVSAGVTYKDGKWEGTASGTTS